MMIPTAKQCIIGNQHSKNLSGNADLKIYRDMNGCDTVNRDGIALRSDSCIRI